MHKYLYNILITLLIITTTTVISGAQKSNAKAVFDDNHEKLIEELNNNKAIMKDINHLTYTDEENNQYGYDLNDIFELDRISSASQLNKDYKEKKSFSELFNKPGSYMIKAKEDKETDVWLYMTSDIDEFDMFEGTYEPEITFTEDISYNSFKTIVDEKFDGTVKKMSVVIISDYQFQIIYFKDDKNTEYIIPYGKKYLDDMKLKSGELYTADEFMKKYADTFDDYSDKELNSNSQEAGGTGDFTPKYKSKNDMYYKIILSVLVISVFMIILIFVIKKQKK